MRATSFPFRGLALGTPASPFPQPTPKLRGWVSFVKSWFVLSKRGHSGPGFPKRVLAPRLPLSDGSWNTPGHTYPALPSAVPSPQSLAILLVLQFSLTGPDDGNQRQAGLQLHGTVCKHRQGIPPLCALAESALGLRGRQHRNAGTCQPTVSRRRPWSRVRIHSSLVVTAVVEEIFPIKHQNITLL